MQSNRTKSHNRSIPRYFIAVVVLILMVAAALRLWGLPGMPPGPHYDEAANGILAAEIANGVKTPIFIPSYTGKEVLFFYGVAALMRLLGAGMLALRFTAALAGLLTVAATLWLVRELFADDDPDGAPWLAALTAALLATSFWHVLLSRIGFRAITQPLLQALALAALWRGLRRNDWRWLLLGGAFFGLTAYTYLAARAFPIPLVISLVVLWVLDVGRRKARLMQCAGFALAALVSFAPLGLYFARNPDEFTNRVSQIGPGGNWGAIRAGLIAAVEMLFLRGDPYIRFNLPLRPLFGPIIALLLIAGIVFTLWRLFRPRESAESPALERAREMLLLAWIPVMLLPTALAVQEITPSNLRAVGLIPLVFIFPARGLWAFLTITQHVSRHFNPASSAQLDTPHVSRFTQRASTLPLLITCLLLFVSSFFTARAYFHEYQPRSDLYEASDGDLADIAAYLNQTDLAGTSVYVGSIHYRHPTLAFLADAFSQIKWLVGASTAVYPADDGALYVYPRSAPPDDEWFARYVPEAVPVAAPTATDGAPAFSGYHLVARPALSGEALANYSGVVRLLDYRVERAVSGDEVDVTIVWQIQAPSPYRGLTPFYHLVDPWGQRWGQAEPFQYAAEDWTPGEIVVDRVQVPIAPGAPPGDYVLEAGLYSQGDAARLAVTDSEGNFSGTTAPLPLTIARAEKSPHPDELGIRQRLDLDVNDDLTLLGVNLDTAQVRPGERVHLTLFWQTNQDPGASPVGQRADYALHLFLQGIEGDKASLYRGEPVHGTYPTSRWIENEIIVDRLNPRLPLDAVEAPPGDYAVALEIAAPSGETLLGPRVVGTIGLMATDRTFDAPALGQTLVVTFADQIQILGYDLDAGNAGPGGNVDLTLYWRALAEMDTGYTVFTHLLDSDGRKVAQKDNPPVNGTYPTTLWLPGEIIADPFSIALPVNLGPGDYTINVGFYIADNGLRLADPVVLDTIVTVSP